MKSDIGKDATLAHRPGSAWAALLLASCLGLTAPVAARTAPTAATGQDQPSDELVPPTSANDFTSAQLDSVLNGSWRPAASRARDVYRHPKATLQFFDIRPDLTVIEITPGSGWYSEILAPLLHDNGHYVAAVQAPTGNGEARSDDDALHRKFAADPAHYGNATFVEFDPKAPVFGPPASADLVLTFRNVHNWVMAGTASAMFKAFYAVLKPGGVLGVVDHRADSSAVLAAV
ncbi:MAG: methyltransferase, partial [Rhodanobacter sp.]|nr:methyltransferase [Rhodanobacter sp.]